MFLKHNVDGIKNYDGIPSVTGLLSLLEMPSLDHIKELPNFERIMKDAGIRGTYVHKFIENDLLGKEVNIIKKHSDYIKQWFIYKYGSGVHKYNNDKEYKLELEKEIKTNEVGGTIDYTLRHIKDNDLVIKDWKTSSSGNVNEELMFKYKLQLGGYYHLTNSLKHGYTTGKIIIFSPKGFKVINLNHGEMNNNKDMFKDLMAYYSERKNGIEYSHYDLGGIRLRVKDNNKKIETTKATKIFVDDIAVVDQESQGLLNSISSDILQTQQETMHRQAGTTSSEIINRFINGVSFDSTAESPNQAGGNVSENLPF